MTVTAVVMSDKNKYKIYLNDEFAFVLYKGEIHKYGLSVGTEVSKELYETLLNEVLTKRAKLRAMNLLTKRPYTRAGLIQKLQEGLYPECCVDAAIQYVESFGYINDEQYALDFANYHISFESAKVIKQKLMTKGVPKDVIEKVLRQISEEAGQNGMSYEEEQIIKLIEKKYKGCIPAEEKEYIKMQQFLLRKGYSFEMIRHVILNNFNKKN